MSGLATALAGTWPLLLMFLVMYFFFLRPQQQKAKEQDQFLLDLQKGDEVVTGSGIIGKINSIEGAVVTLQVDPKTYIRVTKSSISKELSAAFKSNVAQQG